VLRNGVVIVAGTASTSYTDSGLAAGTTYTYNVQAVGPAGTSANSMTASATTTAIPPPPAAAPTLYATSGSVAVTWTAVSGASSYNVLRNGAQIVNTAATTYTNTGTVAGTTYNYNIQSVGAAGTSANSPTGTVVAK
jgi:chitodextrinase